MDREEMERSDLEHRISEAGWHILRAEQVPDGFMVELQQGPPTGFHLHSEVRTSQGSDRNDAYRHFLEELALMPSAAHR
jgi:hypothetical protein